MMSRRPGRLLGGLLADLSPQRMFRKPQMLFTLLLLRKHVAHKGTQRPRPAPWVRLLFHMGYDTGSLEFSHDPAFQRSGLPHLSLQQQQEKRDENEQQGRRGGRQ